MIAYHDFVIGEGLEMNMAILTMRAKKYFIQLLETGHLFVPHVWPMSYIARIQTRWRQECWVCAGASHMSKTFVSCTRFEQILMTAIKKCHQIFFEVRYRVWVSTGIYQYCGVFFTFNKSLVGYIHVMFESHNCVLSADQPARTTPAIGGHGKHISLIT